jgi:N-ethylmaleimide reductase
MTTTLTSLLSPLTIGDLHLRNRVVLAPMTRARSGLERIPNALMATYYQQRASAGLLLSEATTISPQGNGWQHSPGIYTDAQTEGWRQVVDAVHAQGTPIFLQLWHCGRASHSDFQENGQLPVAASAIPIPSDEGIHTPQSKKPYETPRALETAEVSGVVEDYRKAAERAKQAGFDGVEIHAANGYLIDTFLQSTSNQRTDAYGGSIENRYRFLGEIVAALTHVFPSQRVGVRLSPNGVYNGMGSPDFREAFLYYASQLNSQNLAYLHLLDGLAFGFHELGTPMTLAEFRQVFKGPLMGNCGYTQEEAEATIARGDADLISFGRPFISNPDLVERFSQGWPLNPPAEVSDWYSFEAKGYTDFPSYHA